jgi:sulfatase maturation enzyme AslB (radical SAM superfamily)
LNWISAQEPEELDFEFFGGEPTVHLDLLMFAWMLYGRFQNKLVRLEILTNLIKPLGYYEMGFPPMTKFSCSYHSDSGDGDEWMEKVLRLHEQELIGDVKMVMTPDNEEYIAELFNRYKDNSFRIYEVLPQEQLEGTEWAEGLKDKYGECIFDYIGDYRPRTNYKGMVCTAGYKISQQGDLYHCWRKFNDPKSDPLTNVFEDKGQKMTPYHICSYDDCDINDVEFPKYTLEEFKNEVSKRGNR